MIIYHRVSPHMIGDVLYPMNMLAELDQKLYDFYRSGYVGREKILNRRILELNCLWNDVIHCSPVHPDEVNRVLVECGAKSLPVRDYFEIDTTKDIQAENTVIFFRSSDDDDGINIQRLGDVSWGSVAVIPELTRAYYRQVAMTGEKLFAYHGIPHVLYKGAINTKSLRRITV